MNDPRRDGPPPPWSQPPGPGRWRQGGGRQGVAPPSPTAPTGAAQREVGGIVAGLVLAGIGVLLLLGQVVPDAGLYVVLFIGLVFLAVFVATREYGFLVPGCIISGVGVGVVLSGAVDGRWSGTLVLLSIAGGFTAIWLISRLSRAVDSTWLRGASDDLAKALWWPLIPAGILALVSLVVLAESGLGSDVLRWWPVLLIGAGVLIMLASRRRRDRWSPPGQAWSGKDRGD